MKGTKIIENASPASTVAVLLMLIFIHELLGFYGSIMEGQGDLLLGQDMPRFLIFDHLGYAGGIISNLSDICNWEELKNRSYFLLLFLPQAWNESWIWKASCLIFIWANVLFYLKCII